jgi:hypothetical protein
VSFVVALYSFVPSVSFVVALYSFVPIVSFVVALYSLVPFVSFVVALYSFVPFVSFVVALYSFVVNLEDHPRPATKVHAPNRRSRLISVGYIAQPGSASISPNSRN